MTDQYSTAEEVFVEVYCMKCSHAYTRQDDADTIYCRLRTRKCPYMEREETRGD